MVNDEKLKYCIGNMMRLNISTVYMLMDRYGLYPGQAELLSVLKKNDGISQKEIAARMETSKVTVAKMIKRMEQIKMLERRNDEKDKRINLVYITSEGEKALQKAEKIYDEMFLKSIEGIDKKEKDVLVKTCGKITSNLRNIKKELKLGKYKNNND